MRSTIENAIQTIDIQQLQLGNPESFRHLYRIMGDELTEEAQLTPMTKEDRELIVQLSFISCWFRCGDLLSANQVVGMLYSAILHNIQICKSGNNERFINEGTLIRAILNDPSQNAYFVNTYGWPSTEGEQETELLRDVFYLYFRRQLSSKDIAQHLQIPTQTINTFITRAMKTVYYIFT